MNWIIPWFDVFMGWWWRVLPNISLMISWWKPQDVIHILCTLLKPLNNPTCPLEKQGHTHPRKDFSHNNENVSLYNHLELFFMIRRLPSHLRGTQILPAKCPKHHERDIRPPWSLHLQDFKVNSFTLICHIFVVVAFKDNVLYIRPFIENAGLDTVNWSLECLFSFAIWPLAEDLFF